MTDSEIWDAVQTIHRFPRVFYLATIMTEIGGDNSCAQMKKCILYFTDLHNIYSVKKNWKLCLSEVHF